MGLGLKVLKLCSVFCFGRSGSGVPKSRKGGGVLPHCWDARKLARRLKPSAQPRGLLQPTNYTLPGRDTAQSGHGPKKFKNFSRSEENLM